MRGKAMAGCCIARFPFAFGITIIFSPMEKALKRKSRIRDIYTLWITVCFEAAKMYFWLEAKAALKITSIIPPEEKQKQQSNKSTQKRYEVHFTRQKVHMSRKMITIRGNRAWHNEMIYFFLILSRSDYMVYVRGELINCNWVLSRQRCQWRLPGNKGWI